MTSILPPGPPRCTAYSPSVKCVGRRTAESVGEFFYSYAHRGFILGEDRMVSKILRDEHKQPYVFPWCPWCGGALPDMGGVVERVQWADSDNPPKPNGEDGG